MRIRECPAFQEDVRLWMQGQGKRQSRDGSGRYYEKQKNGAAVKERMDRLSRF